MSRSALIHAGSVSHSVPSMSNNTACSSPGGRACRDPSISGARRSSPCIEVLGLGVVDDEGIGGLLRVQLQLLAELDPDPLRLQQPDEGRAVLQVRAGGITEG